MKPSQSVRRAAAAVALAASLAASGLAQAADTIKVGILHSLSGTMAISETTLKDTMLMLIEEQNKKREGESIRRVWLLDLGFAKIRTTRVRGTEQPAVLPGAVRG